MVDRVDRAAIVTGASSGIGLAIATMLAEDGHAVTLAARRPEKLGTPIGELSTRRLDQHRELNPLGIKSTALCPGFVDTPMTDFLKDRLAPEAMIQSADIVAGVRMLLALTAGCVVPEIMFERPSGGPPDLLT